MTSWKEMRTLGSLDSAELLESGDDLCRPVVNLIFAESMCEGLKFRAQQDRVTACRNRSATEYLNRCKAAQIFQVYFVNRHIDSAERDLVFEHKREISLYSGKPRQRS